MSEFVNYNKRDISLPLGCKDLIDVLHRNEGQEGLRRRLADVEPVMERAARSKAVVSHMMIHSLCGGASISYISIDDSGYQSFHVSAQVRGGSDAESAARKFFASRGLSVSESTSVSNGLPRQFAPDGVVVDFSPIEPLRRDTRTIAGFFEDFFCECLGLDRASELTFDFYAFERGALGDLRPIEAWKESDTLI